MNDDPFNHAATHQSDTRAHFNPFIETHFHSYWQHLNSNWNWQHFKNAMTDTFEKKVHPFKTSSTVELFTCSHFSPSNEKRVREKRWKKKKKLLPWRLHERRDVSVCQVFLWMSRNLSSSSLTHSKRLKYWNTQWEIIWVKASTRQGGNVYSVLLCFFFFSRFVEFVLAAGAGGGGRVVAKIANIRYK